MDTFAKLSKEKQATILDAATDCFANKGYYGASIKDICHKANISNGALYKYFTNKEELFLAVLYKCQEILVEHLYQKYTQIEHSFIDTVEGYLQEIIHIHDKYPSYIKVYANLGSNNMEQFSQKLQRPFMKSANYIHDMVSEAKYRNEVKSSLGDIELSFLLDNYFILFLNSLVSDYHEVRFRFFLKVGKGDILTSQDKINFILQSISTLITD